MSVAGTLLAVLLSFSALGTADFPPDFFADGPSDTSAPPRRSFLSATLGSNMVLQRAPQQAVVWGFTTPGATVSITMDDASPPMTSKAGANGIWRQTLPAMEASEEPHKLSFNASTGERAQMDNVPWFLL